MPTAKLALENLNLPLPKWLIAALSLKPHGDNLLSPQAHLWIGFVRIIVGALALIEGLSWAYVGSFLGRDTLTTWLFGLLLGAVIFVFVWGIDVSLMSLDVSEQRKTHRRQGKSGDTKDVAEDEDKPTASTDWTLATVWEFSKKPASTIWEFTKWPAFPVGVRGGLIALSVFVTAPFISMYVLQADIEHELLSRFQTSFESVKQGKQNASEEQMRERLKREAQATSDVQVRLTDWNRAQADYVQEVAGKGKSGKYGDGAAARAAQTVAADKKIEYELARKRLQTIESNRSEPTQADKELTELETAYKNQKYDVLRSRFGIVDVPDSFVARNKVMRENFEGKPEFRRVEYSVYSLLSFLATALFLLKYFEPKSVEDYFSETKQSHWHEYTIGSYDYLLEDKDLSTNRGGRNMSPFCFCQLLDEVILPKKKERDFDVAAIRVDEIDKKYFIQATKLKSCESALDTSFKVCHDKQAVQHEHRATLDKLKLDLTRLKHDLHLESRLLQSDEKEKLVTKIDETQTLIYAQHLSLLNATADFDTSERENIVLKSRHKELVAELDSVSKLKTELEIERHKLAQAAIVCVNS